MKLQRHLGIIAFAAVTTVAASGTMTAAAADAGVSATGEQRWSVDMRGRPPFKRERVPAETVTEIDMAAMEVAADGETQVIWERSYRGRPPFSRSRVEVPVVDAASMELTTDNESRTRFRGRPPFKRHR